MIFKYWPKMVSKASSLCTMAPNTRGWWGGNGEWGNEGFTARLGLEEPLLGDQGSSQAGF